MEKKKHTVTIFSFGAGVQSTAILYLMMDGSIPRADVVMFSDTGWETPATYKHMEECKALAIEKGFDFRIVTNGSLRDDLINGIAEDKRIDTPPFFTSGNGGPAGLLFRKCTSFYKGRPLDREITKIRKQYAIGKAKPDVLQVFGISTDEIQRMRMPPIKKKWLKYSYPLCWDLRWSRRRCLDYLQGKGVYAPKSACIGCPYHDHAHWVDMRKNDPESFEDAKMIDALIRDGVSGSRPGLFLHRSCLPLDEAVSKKMSKEEELEAMSPRLGFDNECSGFCGV